jgi:hypothetical protein
VLRSVHQLLEQDAELVEYTGHTVGATSLEAGARIIGDTVRLDELPVPGIILSFEAGDGARPTREDKNWQLTLLAFGRDVFEAADLIDLIESLCVNWTRDPAAPQPLNQLRLGPHQRFDAEGPGGRTAIGVQIALTVSWIS